MQFSTFILIPVIMIPETIFVYIFLFFKWIVKVFSMYIFSVLQFFFIHVFIYLKTILFNSFTILSYFLHHVVNNLPEPLYVIRRSNDQQVISFTLRCLIKMKHVFKISRPAVSLQPLCHLIVLS